MSLVNSPLSDDFTADFMEANVEWPDPASTIGGRAFADQVMAETPNIAPSSIWDWNKTRFRGWSSPEPQSMWSEDPGPMLAYDDVEDDASLPSSTEADDLCKKLHPSTKPQSSPLHLELTGGVTQSCVFSSPFLENDDDKYSGTHDDSSAQLGHTSTQVLPEKVPTISLADLGDLGYEIGCGGPKGSSVYKVWHEGFGAQPLALKIYREQVLEDEMDFIQTMYDAEHEASGSPNRRQRLAQGLQHLVIPVAVVVDDEGKNCGLLMPLYQYSLGCLLEKQVNVGPMSQSSLSLPVVPDSDERTLLSGQRFCPTVATEIITAISYQLLQAIALVNSGLSHAPDGLGFSHNDIHLGNVVANPDGTVALCDFELVTPIVDRRHSKKRLPPLCRQSPNGLFASDADTWAFALIVINLLTGVDPLFSSERIQDDFGDGPLLAPYNGCDGPTLDWEANIGPHVEELLLLMNPSGERLFHAEPLLALCGRCLVNRPGATASTAMELLTDPVFHLYHTGERSAEAVVKEWLEAAYV